MKKTVLALTVAVSALLATGCNKEGVSYSGDKAQLTLSLTATGSFVEVSPVSKSEETADVNEFAINIVDVASGRTVYSWFRREAACSVEPTRVLRLSECNCNGRQYGPGLCRLHYRQYESDGTLHGCVPR